MGGINFEDLQWEKQLQPHAGLFQSKTGNLMFALELDRRSRQAGWGIVSNAAHPGFAKTNLQLSGPSHGRTDADDAGTVLSGHSAGDSPFMWQEVDEGILPALYAAASPQAQGGAFYGPRGFYELAGGGVKTGQDPQACHRTMPTTGGSGRSPSS